MTLRYKRKIHKKRGTRHNGKGNVKKNRGAGNRGGRGNAGVKKHKFTHTVKYNPNALGSRGFFRKKQTIPTINLWEIVNLIKKGVVNKKDDVYEFNFDGKVLGTGSINVSLILRARFITDKAKEKIEKNGGKVELIR